jgi:hypothetical protein
MTDLKETGFRASAESPRGKPKEERLVRRAYVISWKEIKEKLGLKGDCERITLWRGRSPNQIEAKVSADVETYEFTTIEVVEND